MQVMGAESQEMFFLGAYVALMVLTPILLWCVAVALINRGIS